MKYIKLVLQIVVSLLFLYLAFKNINFKESITTLKQIDIKYLMFGVILHFSSFFVRAERWKYLLKPIKDVKYSSSFQVLTVSYSANNLIPFRAGDVLRAYWMGNKEGVSKVSSFSTVMTERISDGLTLLLFVAIGLSLIHDNGSWVIRTIILALLLFFAAISFIVLIVRYRDRFIRLVLRLLPRRFQKFEFKISEVFTNILSGFDVIKSKRTLVQIIITSLLIWILEGSIFAFTALSFSIPLEQALLIGFIAVSIVNLGIMIPSSPGYVGTFEFFCMFSLSLILDSTIHISGAYSIVVHLAQYFPITITGIVLWFFMKNPSKFRMEERK